ncbi:MAG TPA: glycoside hydrolase family 3 N-terminal domain-containing protein [Mycobacteriales bacterium]|nr:glycoside hydrolase family 3 N-terminal domain-containing protein [Mycobacteriales bacterium]
MHARRPALTRFLSVVCASVVGATAACSTEAATRADAERSTPSPTPACEPAPLAERAGAVLMVGLTGVTEPTDPLVAEVVADVGVSGVFINHDNVVDAEQLTALVAGLRQQAGRPIAVATDEESGRVAVTRDIVGSGPSPRRLARRAPEEVRAFAAELGGSLAEVGIDLDLAPLLDLDDGAYGGIVGDRSFSADPETAATYGLAFSRGLLDAGVRPTVKHFPGQGRSDADTHAEAAVVEASLDELRDTDLLPFQRAVDAGIPVVMLNHLGYAALDGDLPASLSPKAYELLREMGFEGVAMTDSLGMGAVNLRWDFPEAAVRAIEAGADVALATDGRQAVRMRDAIVSAVDSGRLPEERLDEAAARATALAGGDPEQMSCVDVELPTLTDDTATAPTPSGSTPSGAATASTDPS